MQENVVGQEKDGLTRSITLDKTALENDGCEWWKGVLRKQKWCGTASCTRREGQHHRFNQRLVKKE